MPGTSNRPSLGVLQGYFAIARRSADQTLSVAWSFGLVCFAMLLAAGGLAIEILAFDGERGQLGAAALGALLGGAGTLWCIRMRRRRLALRARWRTAAGELATNLGGSVLTLDETLAWLAAHWTHPIRIEDFTISPCAHAIATPSALIHVEPEGTKHDSELPEAHLVVLAPSLADTAGFAIERAGDHAVARLDADACARLLATPDAFSEVTPLVRRLLG